MEISVENKPEKIAPAPASQDAGKKPEKLIQPPSPQDIANANPAQWVWQRMGQYITTFEKSLDEDHEVGARLVSFGETVTFHIENMGFHGPDIISFIGKTSQGQKVQLIQHYSQLSVLLMSMRKMTEKPNRLGFLWLDEEDEDEEKGEGTAEVENSATETDKSDEAAKDQPKNEDS